MSRTSLVLLFVFVVVAWLLTRASPVALAVAALAVWVLFKAGFAMLGGLAQPVPAPPPPGELRRVKIMYRCTICGHSDELIPLARARLAAAAPR